MLKSKNQVETNKYELEIEVSAEAFEEALQRSYLKNKAKITINGFRPGKAPRKMMELLDAQVDKMRDAYGIRGRDMNDVLCHHDDIMGDDGNA